ncbi:hypothetical protein [Tepidibacter thalassicus]|nr:hypothetical protein [Tepidibacter thalassicus]
MGVLKGIILIALMVLLIATLRELIAFMFRIDEIIELLKKIEKKR